MYVLMLGAITAAGLLLRLPSFNDSLWADELSTYFIVKGHSLGHVLYLMRDHSIDLNPPLYFIFAWATGKLGDSAHLVRVTSLVAGTAAIPLTYLLGLQTVGRRAALVGAALMALSPFAIFYSSEGRPYALLMVLVLLSTIALLRALDTERARWWAAYAACACAALYTSYVAAFPLAVQFGWALWTASGARRELCIASVAAAIGFAPWVPTVLKETNSPGVKAPDLLTPLSLHNIAVDLGRLSIGHPGFRLAWIPGGLAVTLIAAGLTAALLGVAIKVGRARRARDVPTPSGRLVLVALLAMATPALIAFYSWIAPHSVWDANKLLPCLPGLALTAAALALSGDTLVRLAAVGLLIAGFAVGAAKMLQARFQRPDYEAAAGFIDRSANPVDPVLDWSAPTPRPLTALDVALASTGSHALNRHTVLRVGIPSLEAMLAAAPYAPLPVPPTGRLVAEAEAMARGGKLFVVSLGDSAVVNAVTEATGIPKRFRLIETRTFRGQIPVSVAVFRG